MKFDSNVRLSQEVVVCQCYRVIEEKYNVPSMMLGSKSNEKRIRFFRVFLKTNYSSVQLPFFSSLNRF